MTEANLTAIAALAPCEQTMRFCISEAKALLSFFGGSNSDVSVQEFPERDWPDGTHAEAGKYAWCSDYPEEGAMWLGPHDIDTEEHDDIHEFEAKP